MEKMRKIDRKYLEKGEDDFQWCPSCGQGDYEVLSQLGTIIKARCENCGQVFLFPSIEGESE